jgi:hypothetical protein
VDGSGISVIAIGYPEDIRYFCDELAITGRMISASADEDVRECDEYVMISPMISHVEFDGRFWFLHPLSPDFSKQIAYGISITPVNFRLQNGVWFEHAEIGKLLGWFGRYRICGSIEVLKELYIKGFSSIEGEGFGVALRVST